MKTLRDLAQRVIDTRRRSARVWGRPSRDFAQVQVARAQYAFYCADNKLSRAETVLHVHNEARAELLDELERAIQLEADVAYGALGDGLETALEILRRYRGKA